MVLNNIEIVMSYLLFRVGGWVVGWLWLGGWVGGWIDQGGNKAYTQPEFDLS